VPLRTPGTQYDADLTEPVVVIHALGHDLACELQQGLGIACPQCRDEACIRAVQCAAGPLDGDEIVERRQSERPKLVVALTV
jgi:hypothetical protein